MPNVADFKKANSKASTHKPAKSAPHPKQARLDETEKEASKPVPKRRPGRDATDKTEKTNVVEVEPMTQMNLGDDSHSSDHSDDSSSAKTEANKIEINFPGSEVLRAKFPKSFDAAETVVTDWVQDGKFEALPEMGHPMAKAAVQQGLLKAKEIEKKVMASPVTEKVAMQAFTYAMKAQTFVNQLKSKMQERNKK